MSCVRTSSCRASSSACRRCLQRARVHRYALNPAHAIPAVVQECAGMLKDKALRDVGHCAAASRRAQMRRQRGRNTFAHSRARARLLAPRASAKRLMRGQACVVRPRMRAHTVGASWFVCLLACLRGRAWAWARRLRHLQRLTIVADRSLVGLPQLLVLALQTAQARPRAPSLGAALRTRAVGSVRSGPSPAASEATPLRSAPYPAT
jgi:hypothetical protein